MKRYDKIWLCATLLAACTACNQEEAYELAPSNGQEVLIVDYLPDTNEKASTRAGSDDNRINSLHYLVYDTKTGELVKQRVIPGIDQVTSWPLKRENMTWEQRLALQDTLRLETKYHVFFVANADPKLFGKDQTDLLKDMENYAQASLTLPQTAFDETKLYYLWSQEIAPTEVSHDTPLLKNVLLQRIVTRTDVKRMDIPATEPERDDFICRMIKESLFEDLTCRGNASKEEGRIRKEIKAKIKKFLNLTDDWAAIALKGNYTSNILNMQEVLNNENNIDLIIASLRDAIVRDNLLSKLKGGTLLNNYLRDWNLSVKAEVHYSSLKRVNSFRLNRTFAGHEGTDNPVYTCSVNNGKFSFYALAANNAADADLNQIKKVSLYYNDPDAAPGAVSQIDMGDTWNTRQDMNTLRTVTCNPIRYIREQGNLTEKTDYPVNLETVLQDKWDASLFTEEFKQAVKDIIFNQKQEYGTSFADFSFSLSLPTLDETQGGVSISAEWNWQSNP